MTPKTVDETRKPSKSPDRWTTIIEALRLGGSPFLRVGTDIGSVGDDAELGDILRSVWCADGESDAPVWKRTYLAPAARSVGDELFVVQLACEREADIDTSVMARLVARMRRRLIVAEWLDNELACADGAR